MRDMASPEPSLLLFIHFPECYSPLTSFYSYSPVILLHEVKVRLLVTQMCLTLFDTMDMSLSGSQLSVEFSGQKLECVAISFSRRSS